MSKNSKHSSVSLATKKNRQGRSQSSTNVEAFEQQKPKLSDGPNKLQED